MKKSTSSSAQPTVRTSVAFPLAAAAFLTIATQAMAEAPKQTPDWKPIVTTESILHVSTISRALKFISRRAGWVTALSKVLPDRDDKLREVLIVQANALRSHATAIETLARVIDRRLELQLEQAKADNGQIEAQARIQKSLSEQAIAIRELKVMVRRLEIENRAFRDRQQMPQQLNGNHGPLKQQFVPKPKGCAEFEWRDQRPVCIR